MERKNWLVHGFVFSNPVVGKSAAGTRAVWVYIEPFLQENVDSSAATQAKLLETLHDPQQLLLLKVKLAAIIDMGMQAWKEMDFLLPSAIRKSMHFLEM